MDLLEARNIEKAFPGVRALNNVDFRLKAGEVHALVGANGAGKSTLIKIISGVYSADSGSIFLEEKEVKFSDPGAAQSAGIGTIFQDFELANNLTVAENISLGKHSRKAGRIDWAKVKQQAEEILDMIGVSIDPQLLAGELGVGEQQIIEIARVLSNKVKVLIMDEPTSSLSNEDVERLFEIIRRVTDQGVGVIYISHRMEEVFRITDRVTVLRDGNLVGSYNTKEVEPKTIVSAMLGDRRHEVQYREGRINEELQPILSVKELSGPSLRSPVSLELRKGEILGLAGLMGSGRTEILKSLFGLGGKLTGEIAIDGKAVTVRSPYDAMQAGLAMVPEDRLREGVLPNLSIRENISVACYKYLVDKGIVKPGAERKLVKEKVKEYNVKTPSAETLISTLSGGNQQKVVFAKWCSTEPSILLLDEPTRGIDVGAKAEIYDITNRLVEEGLSVLLVSSELKELLDICDRILVVRNGKITDEVLRPEFDYKSITAMMMGADSKTA